MEKKKRFSLKPLLESNVSLDSEEKGILRYLGNKKEEQNLRDITKYLKDHGYENLSIKDAREKMDYLVDVGYVRSKTKGKGDNREDKFYLARGIGGGGRRRRELQGRGIVYDTSRLIKRLFGFIFLLTGLGFLIYQGLAMTGAVISSTRAATPTFVLAFALFIIGGILLIKSLEKK